MLRPNFTLRYRMQMGQMVIDYKIMSRDMCKSAAVEGAVVDPSRRFCTAPMHWLDALRSPSNRLPNGYFRERPVFTPPPSASNLKNIAGATSSKGNTSSSTSTSNDTNNNNNNNNKSPNAIRAGPLVMHIHGEASPVVVHVDFINPAAYADFGMASNEECDMRVGLEAIEQCTLFHELRPGGLLSKQSVSELRRHHRYLGMQTRKPAESPLSARPWTRMKTYFVDELQRGPKLQEYVGYNNRVGHQWRFSQNCKYFRIGLWREATRRNELIEGLQSHSSYQRSYQQSVPEVRFLAPGP